MSSNCSSESSKSSRRGAELPGSSISPPISKPASLHEDNRPSRRSRITIAQSPRFTRMPSRSSRVITPSIPQTCRFTRNRWIDCTRPGSGVSRKSRRTSISHCISTGMSCAATVIRLCWFLMTLTLNLFSRRFVKIKGRVSTSVSLFLYQSRNGANPIAPPTSDLVCTRIGPGGISWMRSWTGRFCQQLYPQEKSRFTSRIMGDFGCRRAGLDVF